MKEIFGYLFAGFGIGIMVAYFIIWFFVVRQLDKDIRKDKKKERQ